jgi:PAS domain S-box-containing protein
LRLLGCGRGPGFGLWSHGRRRLCFRLMRTGLRVGLDGRLLGHGLFSRGRLRRGCRLSGLGHALLGRCRPINRRRLLNLMARLLPLASPERHYHQQREQNAGKWRSGVHNSLLWLDGTVCCFPAKRKLVRNSTPASSSSNRYRSRDRKVTTRSEHCHPLRESVLLCCLMLQTRGTQLHIALAEILDNLFDEAVYFVDADRRISFWNRSAERLTGFTSSEVVGSRCKDDILNHVDDKGMRLCENGCPVSMVLEDGVPREARVFLHHKDGHRIPIRARILPIFRTIREPLSGPSRSSPTADRAGP